MECYQLAKPICGVVLQDGQRILKSLPQKSLVQLVQGSSVPGLVDVLCNGTRYSVFQQDLQSNQVRQRRTFAY